MTQNNNVEKFHFIGSAKEVVAAKDVAKKMGFKPQKSENGTYYVVLIPEEASRLRLELYYKNAPGWWLYFSTSEYLELMAS